MGRHHDPGGGPVVPLMWSTFVWDWEMETGERLLDSLQHEPEAWPQTNYRAQLIPSALRRR